MMGFRIAFTVDSVNVMTSHSPSNVQQQKKMIMITTVAKRQQIITTNNAE